MLTFFFSFLTFPFFYWKQVLEEAIRSYNKFNFVIKILAASLQEIVDLWVNGHEVYYKYFLIFSFI